MLCRLRSASFADFAALRAIAAAGGSPDGDDAYFEFVANSGRLVVADLDGVVQGFVGTVHARNAVMVCDLFVDPAARGAGVGRRLLGEVLADAPRRTTFSSTHPAALHLYGEFGMEPREQLLTMQGVGAGLGPPLRPAQWVHDRVELVGHFRHSGAIVTAHFVVRERAGVWEVCRVDGPHPQRAITEIVTAAGVGEMITLSVLESHPLVDWLGAQGFEVIDHDVHCSSAGVDSVRRVTCVHRGLC